MSTPDVRHLESGALVGNHELLHLQGQTTILLACILVVDANGYGVVRVGDHASSLALLVLGATEDDMLLVTFTEGCAPHDSVVDPTNYKLERIGLILAGGIKLSVGGPHVGLSVPPQPRPVGNLMDNSELSLTQQSINRRHQTYLGLAHCGLHAVGWALVLMVCVALLGA